VTFPGCGADPDTALACAYPAKNSASPRSACPSAIRAGLSSLVAFALGALLPYLAGLPVLAAARGIAAVASVAGGMAVGRLTGRQVLRSGLRSSLWARSPSGWRSAIVADPDGNDVGPMSPIDQSRRTWPPEESATA
jgi:VIT family protein